jgi:hypothetical protein
MIELYFHPKETKFPIDPYTGRGATALIHFEKKSGYMVTVYTLYYEDNLAIGLGHSFFPFSRFLGYHPQDIEFVAIYEKEGYETMVYFSAHKNEGTFYPLSQCEMRDGKLCVYVALNSHANYVSPGKKIRICGLANDECSDQGTKMVVINLAKNKDHRKKIPSI